MSISGIRTIAATLMTLSALSHIAALWLRELNATTVIIALFGAIYLVIGIGLFGQSRFTLVLGITVPAFGTTLALTSYGLSPVSTIGLSQLVANTIVVIICAVVLFTVRKNPSV